MEFSIPALDHVDYDLYSKAGSHLIELFRSSKPEDLDEEQQGLLRSASHLDLDVFIDSIRRRYSDGKLYIEHPLLERMVTADTEVYVDIPYFFLNCLRRDYAHVIADYSFASKKDELEEEIEGVEVPTGRTKIIHARLAGLQNCYVKRIAAISRLPSHSQFPYVTHDFKKSFLITD